VAKFNIEVDLDWLGEDGNLDNILKDEVIGSITSRISSDAMKDIATKVNTLIDQKVTAMTDLKLAEVLEDFLNKPRTITDRWGDIKQANVTVLDLMKASCDNFMDEMVDSNGKRSDYKAKSRLDWLIEKHIDSSLKRSIEQAALEVKKGLQTYIDTTLKNQIGENVAKVIGIDNISKRL